MALLPFPNSSSDATQVGTLMRHLHLSSEFLHWYLNFLPLFSRLYSEYVLCCSVSICALSSTDFEVTHLECFNVSTADLFHVTLPYFFLFFLIYFISLLPCLTILVTFFHLNVFFHFPNFTFLINENQF